MQKHGCAERFGAGLLVLVLLIFLPPLLCFATILHATAVLTLLVVFSCCSKGDLTGRPMLVWESCCLNFTMPLMILRYLLDVLFSRAAPRGTLPSPAYMSALFGGREVTAVLDNAPLKQGGAGGHGTERAWLSLSIAGEAQPLHVFMKSRTRQFAESFFLNLFGVYQNEVAFYRELLESRIAEDADHALPGLEHLPASFFPSVYSAEETTFRSDFSLVLEDVVASRTTPDGHNRISFPSLSPGEPHGRVRVEKVLTTQATLHAAFFNRAPSCVWRGARPASSPRFMQLVAGATLADVEKRFPSVLSEEVLSTYRLFLRHYETVRAYWDRGNTTLVHGDAHVGNYFFEEGMSFSPEGSATVESVTARMYDFQCVAVEHPMRDVVYHAMSSCGEDVVDELGGDRQLVRFYLRKLHEGLAARSTVAPPDGLTAAERAAAHGSSGRLRVVPAVTDGASLPRDLFSFDEAWFNYRLHGCWVLAAWIISAGAGDKLFETEKARFILERIGRACERIDVRGALEDVLRKTGQ